VHLSKICQNDVGLVVVASTRMNLASLFKVLVHKLLYTLKHILRLRRSSSTD
jgi:hypothetical protein